MNEENMNAYLFSFSAISPWSLDSSINANYSPTPIYRKIKVWCCTDIEVASHGRSVAFGDLRVSYSK